MTVRQVRGTRSYKLTNRTNVCGGPKKSDTPSRVYLRLNMDNRSYRQGRPQTTQPPKCVVFGYHHLFHKPPTLAAGL
tara:strand:- start:1598 stop:1828 length:231 start_codon:yes stop_codon:yes gene_type:complete